MGHSRSSSATYARPQDHRTGLTLTSLRNTQHRTQILNHRFEAARSQPALSLLIHHASHGGKFAGSMRHAAPARASQRSALHNSRNSYRLCGVSGSINVKYGAAKRHSSSVTPLGSPVMAYGVSNDEERNMRVPCAHRRAQSVPVNQIGQSNQRMLQVDLLAQRLAKQISLWHRRLRTHPNLVEICRNLASICLPLANPTTPFWLQSLTAPASADYSGPANKI
uniref:Uncharacterized protein n=1 Tax=Mycetohabitans sp. TaxID=2571162 RepID=A0A6B9HCG5_9BURK|nr:hypothetical protein [Mycetohabitans sp.]